MKKIIKSKSTADLTRTFQKLITDEDIYKFLEQNDISIKEATKYFSEFEIYQNNKSKYELQYKLNQVILKEYKKIINKGLTYLDPEEPYFFEDKILENLNYQTNQSKVVVVKNFLSSPKQGMLLVSQNGIGKTTLCVAFANYKYEKTKEKTLFVFWPDFIEKTKRFKDDNIYFINKVKTAPNLIIDDLGHESITSWSRDDILHPIITYRLEKNLCTYITSNYLVRELQNEYTLNPSKSKKTKSIIDKMLTLTKVYELFGEDLRKKEMNGNSGTK